MLPFHGHVQSIRRRYHTGRYRKVSVWLGPGTLLDIGCGRPCETMPDGAFIQFVGRGTGVDIKPCEGIFPFVRSDIAHLPFPDQTFDNVVTMEILEHVPDAQQALSEIHRVLKDGGLLVASLPDESFLWKIFWFLWEKTYGFFWRDTHTHTVRLTDWHASFDQFFILETRQRHWYFDVIFRLRKKSRR